jgi:octanoyl-[GcvH]:protein N-octanoyltransferase
MAGESGRIVVGNAGVDRAVAQLALPALMLRSADLPFNELVHLYVPSQPTVAFSARDVRSSAFEQAVRVAQSHGFAPVVRSPGGRMVAYDEGAVIIDHVDLTAGLGAARSATFGANARAHANVLTTLGVTGVQVGEIQGEYCPGEFSLNIDGAAKIAGSAQRIAGRGVLFSTVLQVDLSDAVRNVIDRVSAVLEYELQLATVRGLRDFVPSLSPNAVARAFAADYRRRLAFEDGPLPAELVLRALSTANEPPGTTAFRVDDWVRARTV